MSWPGIAGSVALVTGAGQGIGEAVARHLSIHGAAVAILDRNGERARKVANDISARGGRALALTVDVREGRSVEAAVALVEQELGALGILVNAAGVLHTGDVISFSEADWETTFDVNAKGAFLVSRAVAKRMVPRNAGAIVAVASNAARVPRIGMAAYAASKAAVVAYMKCLGLELAPHAVRCNIVSPGSTDTPMQRALWRGQVGPEQVIAGAPETFRTGIPLRKIALPEDVANAVLYLASNLSGHVTMEEHCVDGGASLGC